MAPAVPALHAAAVQKYRQPAFLILWLSLVAGVAYRLYIAFTDDGIFWPDEIYQSLEPAHRLVFGYGLVPWEFIDGARNWALPGLVAFLLKLAVAFGLSEPRQYLGVVHVAFVAAAAGTIWGIYQLARSQGATDLAAACGASCFALGALPIYFGHRAMSETACALPVTLGLWLALRPDASRKWLLWGGSLLGLAVLLRLQCGIFAVGALGVLAARREWRRTLTVFAALCVWAIIFGGLDKLTWGDWFHSAIKYLQFNLIENRAAGWGTSSWSHLLTHLFSSMMGLTLLFAVSLLVCLRKTPGLAILSLVFLALHSATAHKEIRFLMPVLPLLAACVALAMSAVNESIARKVLAPLVLLCGVASFVEAHNLTFGDLGQYPERPQASAWDDYGSVNRLLLAAHTHDDLCGIRIDAAHLAWTGGSTYLHRNAPLYHLGQPSHQTRLFNYVITRPGSGAPAVAKDGDLELVHIPIEPCVADTGYTWRLP